MVLDAAGAVEALEVFNAGFARFAESSHHTEEQRNRDELSNLLSRETFQVGPPVFDRRTG